MQYKSTFASLLSEELDAEASATRKCLEHIPEDLFDWKPHERSMNLGYLSLLCAEIPKWISMMIKESEIDFATFEHFKPQNTAELVKHFDENLLGAKKALETVSEETLAEQFALKAHGKTMFSAPKNEHLASVVNHLVHHRGQLTVFMRLKDIPVPAIYGPSADDRGGF